MPAVPYLRPLHVVYLGQQPAELAGVALLPNSLDILKELLALCFPSSSSSTTTTATDVPLAGSANEAPRAPEFVPDGDDSIVRDRPRDVVVQLKGVLNGKQVAMPDLLDLDGFGLGGVGVGGSGRAGRGRHVLEYRLGARPALGLFAEQAARGAQAQDIAAPVEAACLRLACAREALDLGLVAPEAHEAAAADEAVGVRQPKQEDRGVQFHRAPRSEKERKQQSLRYEEALPWHIEDADGKHVWVGSYVAPLSETTVCLVATTDGKFAMTPLEKWYKFQPKPNFTTMRIEEAEALMKQQSGVSRWHMQAQEKKAGQKDLEDWRKFKNGPSRIKTESSTFRGVSKSEKMDHDEIDFEGDEFQDDDEAPNFEPDNDEDQKESAERIKREQLGANVFGEGDEGKTGLGSVGWGNRTRKAAIWAVLAAEAWLLQGKYIQAQRSLNEAQRLYSEVPNQNGVSKFALAQEFVLGLQRQLDTRLEPAEPAGPDGQAPEDEVEVLVDEESEPLQQQGTMRAKRGSVMARQGVNVLASLETAPLHEVVSPGEKREGDKSTQGGFEGG
ncbi:hypothetical protein BN1723_001574 [Verticillium longisporum]|uniref:Transcription initiation factor IIF subunit alpha n=1 Tax=Verticillium longisporum TaxID=100787 RepID=A0A0G4KGL4_VERLO|nr:hypothetical protein BN1723_001574 [Verticillium longisporum]